MLNIIAIMHVDVKQASLITNPHFKKNDHAQRAGKSKNFLNLNEDMIVATVITI